MCFKELLPPSPPVSEISATNSLSAEPASATTCGRSCIAICYSALRFRVRSLLSLAFRAETEPPTLTSYTHPAESPGPFSPIRSARKQKQKEIAVEEASGCACLFHIAPTLVDHNSHGSIIKIHLPPSGPQQAAVGTRLPSTPGHASVQSATNSRKWRFKHRWG